MSFEEEEAVPILALATYLQIANLVDMASKLSVTSKDSFQGDFIHAKVTEPNAAFHFYRDAISLNEESIIALCEPTIATSCSIVSPSILATLPFPFLQSLFRRTDLDVEEDFVFEVIQEFIQRRRSAHSAEEISELWSCCRFPFLSCDTMARAARMPDIPPSLLIEGMMGFHFVQSGQYTKDKALAFVHSSAYPALFQRRIPHSKSKLTKFNPGLVGQHIVLSEDNTCAAAKQSASSFSGRIVALDGKYADSSHFTFIIRALSDSWTAIGLVEEQKAQQPLPYRQLGHGFYLLSNNGYTWHSSKDTINHKELGFKFTTEDVIKVHFHKGTLTLQKGKEQCQITDISSDDALIPCVLLHTGSVKIIPL